MPSPAHSTAPIKPADSRPSRTPRPSLNPTVLAMVRVCPDCAGPIVRNSGCVNCLQCGWGRCE